MLKSLELSLERYPRNILSLALIGVGIIGFPIALLFSLFFLIFAQAFRISPLGMLLGGLALSLVAWLLADLSLIGVFRQNHDVLIDLIYYHSLNTLTLYSILASFPSA